MPSVKEELEALRSKGVTKKNASKLKDASGLSTPQAAESAMKAEKERLRIANYGKEADTNLKSYNEAKLAVDKGGEGTPIIVKSTAASSSTAAASAAIPPPTTAADSNATEPATNPTADTAADDDAPALGEIDDEVPSLEEVPDLEEMPSMDNIAGGVTEGAAAAPGAVMAAPAPREINRAERKARRVMEKLRMKKVDGIKQCILKMRNGAGGAQGGIFTITAPDCYVSKNGNSYVVFGEARQGGPQGGLAGTSGAATGAQQAEAIQQLAALAKQQGGADGAPPSAGGAAANDSSLNIEEINEDEAVDESGLDKKDIDLVLSQAGCSRSKAVKALKENDGDLVNAIMSLTA